MSKSYKKNPIVVYYSPYSSPDNQYQRLLLDNKLKKVMHYLIQQRPQNPIIPNSENLQTRGYQSCTAVHELVKNTYILSSPLDFYIDLNDNGEIIKNNRSVDFFTERVSSFENSFCIDLFLGILLFCEESLEIELTHPYMNKTEYTDLAFLTSAKYNISSWIRPVPLIYQLWPEIKSFKIAKDDALAYIKFNTDRDIVFKEFTITENLMSQVKACLDHKFFVKHEPLSRLYEKFTKSGLQKMVLKEIKDNLL